MILRVASYMTLKRGLPQNCSIKLMDCSIKRPGTAFQNPLHVLMMIELEQKSTLVDVFYSETHKWTLDIWKFRLHSSNIYILLSQESAHTKHNSNLLLFSSTPSSKTSSSFSSFLMSRSAICISISLADAMVGTLTNQQG